jgi:hypothetical protein
MCTLYIQFKKSSVAPRTTRPLNTPLAVRNLAIIMLGFFCRREFENHLHLPPGVSVLT